MVRFLFFFFEQGFLVDVELFTGMTPDEAEVPLLGEVSLFTTEGELCCCSEDVLVGGLDGESEPAVEAVVFELEPTGLPVGLLAAD